MITKKLLKEILKEDRQFNFRVHNEDTIIVIFCDGVDSYEINVYELSNMCKVWAYENNFILESGFDTEWYCNYLQKDNNYNNDYYIAKTEPEAIFKACQWVLENYV